MPYIKWTVLDVPGGKAIAHITASGAQGLDAIRNFERLGGVDRLRAPYFDRSSWCWVHEVSYRDSLKNDAGDPNFLERVDS